MRVREIFTNIIFMIHSVRFDMHHSHILKKVDFWHWPDPLGSPRGSDPGFQTIYPFDMSNTYEPLHEISNNVACATSKVSDQPAHTRSLIRAFASRLSIL